MKFGNPVQGRIGPFGQPDPASGFVVTQPFKDGPPGQEVHDGLDIDNGGRAGHDPIVAIAGGTVTFADVRGTRAKVVRIDHLEGWSSGYGHLHEIIVHRDDPVVRGQRIGTLGNTGTLSQGPHLHFDISRLDPTLGIVKRLDPWPLLDQNPEEWMPLPLRERYERWTVPAGTPFFTEGPGIGPMKKFDAPEQLQTVAESVDGKWRLLRFQNSPDAPRELLYVQRRALTPKVQGGEPAFDASVVAAIKAP